MLFVAIKFNLGDKCVILIFAWKNVHGCVIVRAAHTHTPSPFILRHGEGERVHESLPITQQRNKINLCCA